MTILLDRKYATRDEVIRAIGEVMCKAGEVTPRYIEGMLEKERQFSTWVTDSVALPHGTNELKGEIRANSVPTLMTALRTLAKRPEIKQDLIVRDYADIFGSTIEQDRMLAVLAAVFGGLGAGLALVGLYGAMAYAVSRRTAEMGVRMALGTRPAQITRMVVRETAALAAIGLLLGVPLGALASRLVAARLFQMRPFDPLAIAAVALVMTAVLLVAALLPAWRAARVDPAEALRTE